MVTSGDHGGRCGQDHITAGRSKDKLLIQCYCDIADVTHLELTALHCRTLLRTSVGIKAVRRDLSATLGPGHASEFGPTSRRPVNLNALRSMTAMQLSGL